ncbi:MAG: AMP-binding protein, partial [Steroidobacteraceae bacterium]
SMGRARAAREPGLYDALVDKTNGEDVAILCTTSGTTANPKLAMLAAGRVLRHCATYLAFDPKGPDDEYVSVLPLPWIMEQVYVLGKGLLCRMKVNFVEQPDTMMNDFREIAPTFVLFAPRVWESIAADVRAGVMDASPLKQSLYELGMKTGLSALARGRHSVVADAILFRALRDRLGFTRLRSAATGGAALGPDTFKFFQAMGVPLRTLYGQTELLGAYTLHPSGEVDPDTTGVPMADSIEIRIDNPDIHGVGEIVVRHPNMFLGYYKSPEASAADMRDGWMQSGDAGYFNANKQLVVIDRIKDLAETARGERFSPQYIENKLKFSPYIAETVVLGAGRDALAAMICIRFSIISKWAEKKRISFTTYTDLASRPEVKLYHFYTNAILMRAPAIARLLRYDERFCIFCSYGGFDRATYGKVMGVDKFDAATANIRLLIEEKVRSGSKIRVQVNLRVPKGNERGEFWDYLRRRSAEGVIHLDGVDDFDNWGGKISDEQLRGAGLVPKPPPVHRGPCHRLITGPMILADGRVNACCCRDVEATLIVGDVKAQPLKDILSGPALKDLLKRHESGDFPDICKVCTRYEPIYPAWMQTGLWKAFQRLIGG